MKKMNLRICEICMQPIGIYQQPEYIGDRVYHNFCRKRELMNMTPQFPSGEDDPKLDKPNHAKTRIVETRTGIDSFRSYGACFQIIKLLEEHPILTKDELRSKVKIKRTRVVSIKHKYDCFENALKRAIRLGAVKYGNGERMLIAVGGREETRSVWGYYLNKTCHIIEPLFTLTEKDSDQNAKKMPKV